MGRCPLQFVGGHAEMGRCPLQFVGGHTKMEGCPLRFAEGHATIEKSVSGFRTDDHPLSRRSSLLRIIDLLHL